MGFGSTGSRQGSWRRRLQDRFPRRRGRPPRLALEALEDRSTPATLWVTSTSDAGPGTLRAALGQANNGDTIQFDPSLLGATVRLTSGELLINKDVTVNGPAADGVTIQNAPDTLPTPYGSRVFEVAANAHATLTGLVITGGEMLGVQSYGAGVYNAADATLTLTNCLVDNNYGESLNTPGADAVSFGGGIFNAGTATVTDSTVSRNEAFGNPAGYVSVSTQVGIGGGVLNYGTLTIADSQITGNQVRVWLPEDSPPGLGGKIGTSYGGGIASTGTLTMTRTVLDSNMAESPPGDSSLWARSFGGGLYATGTTTATDCLFTANTAASFPGTTATYGGGAFNTGALTVQGGAFTGNVADGATASGGGLYNSGVYASAAFTNTTLSGNSAQLSGAMAPHSGSGGAVTNDGGSVAFNFCTITHNTVSSRVWYLGPVYYDGHSYGGGVDTTDAAATFNSTIVAGNTANDYLVPFNMYAPPTTGSGVDVYSAVASPVPHLITSQGHNLIGQADGSAGWVASDQTGSNAAPLDPVLGPLQNNGGPQIGASGYRVVAPTHEVLNGSPALQAGDPASAPATDQRGVARDRARPNVGAYEATLDHFLVAGPWGGGSTPGRRST
jgi:hypothetical protein